MGLRVCVKSLVFGVRSNKTVAKRGGELYGQLVGFVDGLEKPGDRLNQAKDSYDT
jgi:DNA anti-recombination protein RmuC